MTENESAIWTEALKLASQHRYIPYDEAGGDILCGCGKVMEFSQGTERFKQWQHHVGTLQRPQPKPEPRYRIEQSDWWLWIQDEHHSEREYKVAAQFNKTIPNAEARARKLCAELNAEPEHAPCTTSKARC
jgi:hypothetical protein